MPDSTESHGPAATGAGPPDAASGADLRDFAVRVALVAGAAALLFVAWQARQALLLVFSALVVAVIFDAAARPFLRYAHVPRRWALALALLCIALVLGLVGWLVGARVSTQFAELVTALQEAEPAIRGWLGLGSEGGGGSGDGSAGNGGSGESGSGDGGGVQGSVGPLLDRAFSAASWGLGAVGALGSFVLVVVAGYFFASEPTIYKRGMVMLLPRDQQGRTEAALDHVGAGLFDWLKGQLVSMVIVGLLIGLGAWLIGLPAPLALGLFAGLFAFVPVIGPIVGAAPALALAAAQDGATLLWTAGLILAVEQVESNMIMPLVGQHTVHIPPALLMLNVFLFGALFGGVGVVVAAPLTVAVFVLVKKLYVVDVLDQKVDLPGT